MHWLFSSGWNWLISPDSEWSFLPDANKIAFYRKYRQNNYNQRYFGKHFYSIARSSGFYKRRKIENL